MADTGKTKKKRSGIWTVIACIIALLVLFAVAGLIISFVRSEDTPGVTDAPSDTGSLAVSIDGETVTSGTSIGQLVWGRK